jgi:hypothetical protein
MVRFPAFSFDNRIVYLSRGNREHRVFWREFFSSEIVFGEKSEFE